MLTTPANSKKTTPRLSISPGGEWLVIIRAEDGPIEIWDVACRTKVGVFDDGPGEFCGLAFGPTGRVSIARSDKGSSRLRVSVVRLPGCSVVETREVPFGPGQAALFAAGEKCLRVYGKPPLTDDAWDLSTSPPRKLTADQLPNSVFASPDGKHQLAFKRNWALDWELETVATRAVILRLQ